MKRNLTLFDLLEIENDPTILDYKCEKTGLPLWSMIRVKFFKILRSELLSESNSTIVDYSQKKYTYKNLIRTTIYNVFNPIPGRGEILITTSGSVNFKSNGLYRNRLSRYFSDVNNRSLVLEDLKMWEWPFPNEDSNIIFHDPIKFYTSAYAKLKLSSSNNNLSVKLIKLIKNRAHQLFDWEMNANQYKYLINLLNYTQKLIPIRYHTYQKFFKKRNVKIILGRALCYGANDFVLAAKDLGIVVSEYQHGLVSNGHEAYNIGSELANSDEYKKVLPDYFLGYGRWWMDQINIPIQKYILGNAHRSDQLEKISIPKKTTHFILILGNGYDTVNILKFASILSKKLKGEYKIIYRPHPRKRNQFMVYNYKNVHLDYNIDIYESLISAQIVISELSTGLFEAIGLAKRIYTWKTEKSQFVLPDHPFATFTDVDELANKIKYDKEGHISKIKSEDFWAPNWKDNYLHFLREYGGIEC